LKDCQQSVVELADLCGWKEEFTDHMHQGITKLGTASKSPKIG